MVCLVSAALFFGSAAVVRTSRKQTESSSTCISPSSIRSTKSADSEPCSGKTSESSQEPISGSTLGKLLERFELAVLDHERSDEIFPP